MTQIRLSPTIRSPIRLRPMREPDLRHVFRLERLSQPTPWPMSLFRRQLRGGASCWVLERGRQIIGFGIVDFVADWAHVMNMCVAPEFRRQGLGRRLLLHLLGVASQRGFRRAWLEVRVTNRPAILLYTRLGFRTRRIRKGYYRTREGLRDCLVMVRLIGCTLATP